MSVYSVVEFSDKLHYGLSTALTILSGTAEFAAFGYTPTSLRKRIVVHARHASVSICVSFIEHK